MHRCASAHTFAYTRTHTHIHTYFGRLLSTYRQAWFSSVLHFCFIFRNYELWDWLSESVRWCLAAPLRYSIFQPRLLSQLIIPYFYSFALFYDMLLNIEKYKNNRTAPLLSLPVFTWQFLTTDPAFVLRFSILEVKRNAESSQKATRRLEDVVAKLFLF